MKPRARLVLAGSLAALLFIAAVTAAILVLEPYKQRLPLPGGQTVSLERVDYGTVHPFVADPWWERLLEVLFRRPPAPRAPAFYTASRQLGWSIRVQGAGVGPRTLPWMFVMDEHGCSFGGLDIVSSLPVGPKTMLCATATGTFPRRTTNVRVAVYAPNGLTAVPTGYLVLPNPAPGTYPKWTPEPYPITKQAGTVAVRLSGISRDTRWGHPSALAHLSISDAAHPAQEWRPANIGVSDATGNSLERAPGKTPGGYAFEGLCLHEAAWKVTVDLAPQAPLTIAPDATWSLRSVPVPALRSASRRIFRKPGSPLALVETARAGAPNWGGLTQDRQTVFLRLRQSALDTTTVALLRATDDRGRNALGTPPRDLAPDKAARSHRFTRQAIDQDYWVRVAPGARTLDLTFVIYKPRTVTFLAKPG